MRKKRVIRLLIKARKLRQYSIALYYAYKDPITPILPKLIILITLAYALSPIDLIPDFIPLIGLLDDLLILPGLIALSIKLIPEPVMRNALENAKNKPVKMKKNWGFAVFIIILWIAIAAWIVSLFL